MHAVDEGQRSRGRASDRENEHKALHGLTRTLVANMVEGVTTGFTKKLEIIGVGYKAEERPYGLQLALGFSHPIEYHAPEGIKLTAPQPTQVVVEGANKEIVGQVAAEIRSFVRPSRTRARASSMRRAGSPQGRQGGRQVTMKPFISQRRAPRSALAGTCACARRWRERRASAPRRVPLAEAHLRADRGRSRRTAPS